MLVGGVLTARRPHARIVAIDDSAARALSGVKAVLRAEDLSFARAFGVVVPHQPVLAWDRVRQYGDGVVLIAAESNETLERALERVTVEYEDLPTVFDPEEAMLPGAPVIHPRTDSPGPETGIPGEGEEEVGANVFVHHRIRHGEPAEGWAASKVVLERVYRTQHVEHAYLEPEAVLAEPTEDGGARVTGSIQNLYSTRRSLAAVLGCDLARVSVRQAALGGSFGGKDEVMTQMACHAALLARAAGRPVRMVNTREQSMAVSYKRHPYVLRYKAGADAGGRLTAMEIRVVADGGAYASMSPFVTWRSAVQACGPYDCPRVRADVYAVYTNNTYTGAMRGFGAPQVNFAVECLMDELAAELEIDPVDLRRINAYRRGSVTPTGQVLDHEVSVVQVMEEACGGAQWRHTRDSIERSNRERRDGKRRGLGMAVSYRGVSLGAEGVDAAGVLVSIQSDGSVLISSGLSEVGQGISTVLSQIAAEVLGIETRRTRVLNLHTDRAPDSGPTVASRATLMGGSAAKQAAERLRAILFEVAGEALGVPPEELEAVGGRIFHRAAAEQGLSFEEVVRRAYDQGRQLLAAGWFRAPRTTWDEARGKGDAYFTYVYSANMAEVEVDLLTGRVRCLRVRAAHDLGRAISPPMVRSQVTGGVAMGLGYALFERYPLARGVPAVRNLDEYLLATALDVPEVETVLVENPDPLGPFGAKSVGEPATEITAPAVVNAVCHALGRRIYQLPADLEMVLLGRSLVEGKAEPGSPGGTVSRIEACDPRTGEAEP